MAEEQEKKEQEKMKDEKVEKKEEAKVEEKPEKETKEKTEKDSKTEKVPEKTEEKDTKKKKSKTDVKKKKKKKQAEAVINIYTSFNNTIVHVTDMAGQTITKVNGGMVTKHDRLKANPTIAMFIAKKIAEQMRELGIASVYVRIRTKTGNPAPGPGTNAIIKSLSRDGFKILNIMDSTRSPRGGPKIKGGRRGRRP